MQVGLVIVGADHCSAPAQLVERLRDCESSLREAVTRLRANPDISEIIYGTLPNRTDIVLATWNPVAAANVVLEMLTRVVQLRTEDWTAFYRFVDEAAVAHLLRVTSEPDGEQACIQLESCWELSQASGAAGRVLSQLTQALKQHACATPETSADSERKAVRQIWSKLQAEACLPPWARFRNEVDAICEEEVASFRRICGGLMTDDQERAVKIVTARISERVGEWITRSWNDPATRRQPRMREDS